MSCMTVATVALGSNIGDRVAHLQAARDQMPCVRASAIYETAPVDCPEDSPPFLNCVIEVGWHGTAEALHALGKSIEASLGRPAKRGYHEPRAMDVDLLAFGDLVLESPALILPHPRLHLRRFVLQPWAELSPDLLLPGFAFSIRELLERLESSEPPLLRHPRQWNLP